MKHKDPLLQIPVSLEMKKYIRQQARFNKKTMSQYVRDKVLPRNWRDKLTENGTGIPNQEHS